MQFFPMGNLSIKDLAGIGLVLALPLFACGQQKPRHSVSSSYIQSATGAGITVNHGGITVTFGADVSYESKMTTVGSKSSSSILVDGQDFLLEPGRITIGDKLYDGLRDGDHVVVKKDGVYVDDVLLTPHFHSN